MHANHNNATVYFTFIQTKYIQFYLNHLSLEFYSYVVPTEEDDLEAITGESECDQQVGGVVEGRQEYQRRLTVPAPFNSVPFHV